MDAPRLRWLRTYAWRLALPRLPPLRAPYLFAARTLRLLPLRAPYRVARRNAVFCLRCVRALRQPAALSAMALAAWNVAFIALRVRRIYVDHRLNLLFGAG